jgi:polar amino acid transport system permease protein
MILNLTDAQIGYMLKGALATIELSVAGTVGGAIIGLPVALLLISGGRISQTICRTYMFVLQGIPLPVAMFVVYFGIGIFGFDLLPVIAASVALAVNAGAYFGDIWRGAISAVQATQWEAAESLALTYPQKMIHVILPQALRISIPPTVGFIVALIKNSSYAVVIGMPELTYTARIVNNTTFEPFVIFSFAAAIYFLICFPVSRFSARLERSGFRYQKSDMKESTV